MTTGLVYDERFLRHRAPYEHPEHPGRLAAIWEHLGREGLAERCARVEARDVRREELLQVHTEGHVAEIESTARHAFVQLDPDTYTSRDSAEAASLAAGGLVDLVSAVLRGKLENGFALLRPPGHHAEADRAMGFCLYNNVAIAARAAQRLGAGRVAIVDWDLHHGNGTQNSFYGDRDVLYFSTHQFPFYPGTGTIEEVGEGEGRGRTVNVPWPGGRDDADYLAAFERVLLPIARAFEPDLVLVSCGFDAAFERVLLPIARAFDPELVLVSCGFDAAEGDPLGSMRISPAGYALMTAVLRALAGGRLVLALEGGYNLDAIAGSAAACLRVLLGEAAPTTQPGPVSPAAERVLERVAAAQRPFWRGIL